MGLHRTTWEDELFNDVDRYRFASIATTCMTIVMGAVMMYYAIGYSTATHRVSILERDLWFAECGLHAMRQGMIRGAPRETRTHGPAPDEVTVCGADDGFCDIIREPRK